MVVVGDDEIAERAPVVDLWLKAARRNGAEIVPYGPTGNGADARRRSRRAALHALTETATSPVGQRLRSSERAILIWSGSGGGGGARLAEAAHALGFEGKPGCGAFHLPADPERSRRRRRLGRPPPTRTRQNPEPIGLLIVSGDEAAADPSVRALAERAERVIAITMFHGLAVGWADLVLPATSYLERDGTLLNLEGRLQRLRRAVIAPVPDELAWIAKLAGRFDVERLAARDGRLRRAVGARLRRGRPGASLNGRAGLPARTPYERAGAGSRRRAAPAAPTPAGRALPRRAAAAPLPAALLGPLRRARRASSASSGRRPRSSSPPRTPSAARSPSGDTVVVRSNGTSVELRARVNRRLVAGVARVAEEHAADLHQLVEVVKP